MWCDNVRGCGRGARKTDAELDEGAIWECLADPMVPRMGEVLWVIDINRQSLDRVVPDIAAGRIAQMFDATGWHPLTLAFLGGIHRVEQASLGVSDFGQSGDLQDLYRHFGIDPDTIVGAAYDVMQG